LQKRNGFSRLREGNRPSTSGKEAEDRASSELFLPSLPSSAGRDGKGILTRPASIRIFLDHLQPFLQIRGVPRRVRILLLLLTVDLQLSFLLPLRFSRVRESHVGTCPCSRGGKSEYRHPRRGMGWVGGWTLMGDGETSREGGKEGRPVSRRRPRERYDIGNYEACRTKKLSVLTGLGRLDL